MVDLGVKNRSQWQGRSGAGIHHGKKNVENANFSASNTLVVTVIPPIMSLTVVVSVVAAAT